jgi:hypothetical protein
MYIGMWRSQSRVASSAVIPGLRYGRSIRTIITAALFATLTAIASLCGSIGVANAAANTDRLYPGESLGVGQRLISPDGQYVLVMQGDGNLVVYAPGNRAIWATGTNRAGAYAIMQGDGNLVVYAPGPVPVWASGTNGIPNLHFELQTDGNVVLYTSDHTPRWAGASITDRNNIAQVKYSGYVAMRDNGWTDSQWGSLDPLWSNESGWRWNASNPSSQAYGIPQANPGSKMATAGADWHDNPGTQIRWGLSTYIKNRYGSPQVAWSFWQSHHWY